MLHLGGASDLREACSTLLHQPLKRNGSALSQSGEWDHQITVDRGLQRRWPAQEEREKKLMQIKGHPARQAPPHQESDPVWHALWEWKPVHYFPHILGYVVRLGEPTNSHATAWSQPLHPGPWETCEDGTAVVKAAKHKCLVEWDHSFKSQGPSAASIDSSRCSTPDLAVAHLI